MSMKPFHDLYGSFMTAQPVINFLVRAIILYPGSSLTHKPKRTLVYISVSGLDLEWSIMQMAIGKWKGTTN